MKIEVRATEIVAGVAEAIERERPGDDLIALVAAMAIKHETDPREILMCAADAFTSVGWDELRGSLLLAMMEVSTGFEETEAAA